jgi:hypothetical protein
LEEAIFNLVRNMEDLAQKEGKVLGKTHASNISRFRIAEANAQ